MGNMSTAVSARDPREVLCKIAKEMSQSAIAVSERACLVTSADGSKRLAMTGITSVNYTESGIGQGATLHKVSFRFIGDDNDPLCRYHATEDMAWAFVDPRGGNVIFGPEQGILVRQRSCGIGSYILGQLIRLLSQSISTGHIKVYESKLPMSAASVLSEVEQHDNGARSEAMLRRAGFYVSPVGSGLVVGARRITELQSRWDQNKVRFLNPTQLADHASNWLAEVNASTVKLDLLKRDLGLARGEMQDYQASTQQQQQDLDATIALLNSQKQADHQTIAELSNKNDELGQQLIDLANQEPTAPIPDKKFDPPVVPEQTRVLRFELGRGVMVFLWAVLVVTIAVAFTAIKHA